MHPARTSDFIRALVDDASTQPFLASLLALKRQRESSPFAAPRAQVAREPVERLDSPSVERIRERAA